MDEWFINSMMELFSITRAGYVSDISPAIEEVTGKKPITFSEFAKDYSSFQMMINLIYISSWDCVVYLFCFW